MEKDLSLILLLIAGIILLFLFVYSFRTRVDRPKHESLDLSHSDKFPEDENDILTMPSDNACKISASKSFLDDFEDSDAIVLKSTVKETVPVTPKSAPSKPEPIETLENFKPSTLLILHVLPPENEKFIGFDLLQALLVANLRIGIMSIFHRHTLPMGKGTILFSVAQACEPGTFNMNTIGSCRCPGLVMFMQLEGPEHNLELLEQFVQTAQQLADNLGGVVVSQKRNNPFTQEIKKHFVASVQHHLANLGVKA